MDSDRATLTSGDFFVDPLPGADCYVLMDVIHDWADAEAVAILRAVRRAAQRGATVLIVEDPGGPPEPRSRTFERLLAGAGFGSARLIETRGSMCIVEAVAAGEGTSA